MVTSSVINSNWSPVVTRVQLFGLLACLCRRAILLQGSQCLSHYVERRLKFCVVIMTIALNLACAPIR